MRKLLRTGFRLCGIFLAVLLFAVLAACSAHGRGASPEAAISPAAEHNPGAAAQTHQRAMLDPVSTGAAGAAASSAPRIAANALLYYIPNRIIDLIDVFRLDLGVGVSYGGVIRLTRYGQAGYRGFAPRSVRFGLRGRRSPIFVERYPEYGFGPGFVNTGARLPTNFEVGAGADLLLGLYAGISFDELLDFFAGLIFLDPKRDDLNFE